MVDERKIETYMEEIIEGMEKQMYRKFIDNLDALSNGCRPGGTFEVERYWPTKQALLDLLQFIYETCIIYTVYHCNVKR